MKGCDNLFSDKNINDLQLSEEQRAMYNDLCRREQFMRAVALDAGVHKNAVEKIIAKSDLLKVDTDNAELLRDQIISAWGDFIINKNERKY